MEPAYCVHWAIYSSHIMSSYNCLRLYFTFIFYNHFANSNHSASYTHIISNYLFNDGVITYRKVFSDTFCEDPAISAIWKIWSCSLKNQRTFQKILTLSLLYRYNKYFKIFLHSLSLGTPQQCFLLLQIQIVPYFLNTKFFIHVVQPLFTSSKLEQVQHKTPWFQNTLNWCLSLIKMKWSLLHELYFLFSQFIS